MLVYVLLYEINYVGSWISLHIVSTYMLAKYEPSVVSNMSLL